MAYIIFILIKAFSELSCPISKSIVILDDTNPIRNNSSQGKGYQSEAVILLSKMTQNMSGKCLHSIKQPYERM